MGCRINTYVGGVLLLTPFCLFFGFYINNIYIYTDYWNEVEAEYLSLMRLSDWPDELLIYDVVRLNSLYEKPEIIGVTFALNIDVILIRWMIQYLRS